MPAADCQQQPQQQRKGRKSQQQQQHKKGSVAAHACQHTSTTQAPAADSVQEQQRLGKQKPPPQQHKQQKAKFVAVHGNYHRYYGTRKIADLASDPRLKVCYTTVPCNEQHTTHSQNVSRLVCTLAVLSLLLTQIMEKPWFQNRKCLDIGCNEGMITLALASHFGTAGMLGVDIDRSLIGKASRWVIRLWPGAAC